jgi:hypothetical protein
MADARVVVIDAHRSDGDVLHLVVDLGPAFFVGGQAAEDARAAGDQPDVVVIRMLVADSHGVGA